MSSSSRKTRPAFGRSPGDHVEACGLSGSVRAEESNDLSLIDSIETPLTTVLMPYFLTRFSQRSFIFLSY